MIFSPTNHTTMAHTADAEVIPALENQNGEPTPLSMQNPFAVTAVAAAEMRTQIAAAKAAKPEEFTDVTPIYWEARRGESITAAFLGWKEVTKADEKTGEETKRFMAVFHDGNRQIVAGQLALVDAMFGRPAGGVYQITCDETTAGKAKKFTVKEFNG